MSHLPSKDGLCECGCGQQTSIVKETVTTRGLHRGEPRRFIRGHTARLPDARAKISAAQKGRVANRRRGENHPNWKRDGGYFAVHQWINSNHTKTGVCEGCGKVADRHPHDYANITGVLGRERYHWKEFCRSCHKRFDLTRIKAKQADGTVKTGSFNVQT